MQRNVLHLWQKCCCNWSILIKLGNIEKQASQLSLLTCLHSFFTDFFLRSILPSSQPAQMFCLYVCFLHLWTRRHTKTCGIPRIMAWVATDFTLFNCIFQLYIVFLLYFNGLLRISQTLVPKLQYLWLRRGGNW